MALFSTSRYVVESPHEYYAARAGRPDYWRPTFLQWCLGYPLGKCLVTLTGVFLLTLAFSANWEWSIWLCVVIMEGVAMVCLVADYHFLAAIDWSGRRCYPQGPIQFAPLEENPAGFEYFDVLQLLHRYACPDDHVYLVTYVFTRPLADNNPQQWRIYYPDFNSTAETPVLDELKDRGWCLLSRSYIEINS